MRRRNKASMFVRAVPAPWNRGPVLLITIGVIFLIGEYTRFGFGDLWPVLLIVLGIIAVAQAFASRAGHTGA